MKTENTAHKNKGRRKREKGLECTGCQGYQVQIQSQEEIYRSLPECMPDEDACHIGVSSKILTDF
jgi:predicted methyltransferase